MHLQGHHLPGGDRLPVIDAPFSDYEEGLDAITAFSDESRYNLVRKIGFTIDSLEEGYGDNSKWKWSFVELEGRFAAVAKNLLNLKTFIAGHGSSVGRYSARMAHLALARELLQQAADRYREKYELSTHAHRRHQGRASTSCRPCAGCTSCWERADQADVVKKKADIWRTKMENDLKKAEETVKKQA